MVMLQLSSAILNRPVLSLRTGGEIANTNRVIINPDNLKIEGWAINNYTGSGEHVLPTIELREIISKGLVVNDHESITHPEDLVRIRDIIDLQYDPIGKKIITEKGEKVGKVVDYSFDPSSFYIVQLFVAPSIFKGISASQIIVERDDVVELTDKTIVIKETKRKVKAGEPATVRA